MMTFDISPVLNDNTSGSYTLTLRTLDLFKHYLEEQLKTDRELEEIFDEMHTGAKTLIKHQTNMVLLRKSGYDFVNFFKRIYTNPQDRNEIITTLLEKLDEIVAELKDHVEAITANGSKIIANFNKILTYSNSSVITKLFEKASLQKRKFEVFCLKSDPPGEGVILAENLTEMGLKTTLVADTQAGIVMDEINIVLVGADRLYETGFVNKSGTLAVCLLAKQFNVPVYLVAETTKILKESERSIKSTERDVREVYEKDNEITVINSYYEKIPLNLISKVVCEEGVFETPEFISWYLGD